MRKAMEKKQITAYLLPCSDRHGSEYVGAHDECVKYFSGFTGDSAELLVLPEKAYLWTDGRYFVQAEKELKGTGVRLMKMGNPGVPSLDQFLKDTLKKKETFGFYAPLFSAGRMSELTEKLQAKGVRIRDTEDLADSVWENRPARSGNPVRIHELAYAGESIGEKLEQIREEMKRRDCDLFLTAAMDETAWLTNLRGSDILCNPVFLSYLMVFEKSCILFIQPEEMNPQIRTYLKENTVTVKNYDSWESEVKKLKGRRILADVNKMDYGTWKDLTGESASPRNKITDALSPVALCKCIKNKTEIRCMKKSHIRDGVYLTKYLYWLKKNIREGKRITETEASDYLDALRAADRNFVSLSFPTISAYGENAAMCHYQASPRTAAVLRAKGFYLADSGAQYLDGTTDVTRTIALGKTTAAEKRDYTLTVIGMLRLLHAVFPYGIRGTNLDTFARSALWEKGRDFNHGTGHGVGFLNNVHEMPVSVRMSPNRNAKYDLPFVPGMVTSDEPGIYMDGHYGIRTENMILCREVKQGSGFLTFETLTFAPLDPDPLDPSLMKEEDIENYNEYQGQVWEKINPYLTENEKGWLRHETRKISKPKHENK